MGCSYRVSKLTPFLQRDYPRLPQKIASPEIPLQAYFASLAYANHLSPEQLAAAGGIPSMGQEPYHATYNY
jgi:hypothetical protein